MDLSVLAKQLEPVAVCARCKKGNLQLKRGKTEWDLLCPCFSSVPTSKSWNAPPPVLHRVKMQLPSRYCGQDSRTGHSFYIDERLGEHGGVYEINRRMVLGAREIGCGHAALQVSLVVLYGFCVVYFPCMHVVQKLAALVGMQGGLANESFASNQKAGGPGGSCYCRCEGADGQRSS